MISRIENANGEQSLIPMMEEKSYPATSGPLNRPHSRPLGSPQPRFFRPSGTWTPRPPLTQSQRGPRPYLGRCQLCEQQGHSAKRCPTLIHLSWIGSVAPRTQNRPGYASPQANTAAYSFAPSSSEWILDLGATHHVTTDLANFSLHSPYEGSDVVVVGNGAGLDITHIVIRICGTVRVDLFCESKL
ncbi:hypothetical protein F0562_019299 [Nyssa sinensis]|uniref:CCHC-type domain-containing protein n=1 Tax=Nyssa sinensis TaxID=561372 RepID=A0A5J4ZCG9_9ASTE|nr:hypothetical protein F0562_019299 [Nyssa sinensis]